MNKRHVGFLMILLLCNQLVMGLDTPIGYFQRENIIPVMNSIKEDQDDQYNQYPKEIRPLLSINSTLNEELEFNQALDNSEIVEIAPLSKTNIFSKVIYSRELMENFNHFIFGLLSAWSRTSGYIYEYMTGTGFGTPQCSFKAMWDNYYSALEIKRDELSEIITAPIPDDIPNEKKIKMCKLNIKKELSRLDEEIELRKKIIKDHQVWMKEQKKDPWNYKAIEEHYLLHKQALKDYYRNVNQVKNINCKRTVEDPNMKVKFALMTMTSQLMNFYKEVGKCLIDNIPEKPLKGLILFASDIKTFLGLKPLETLLHAVTFGIYGLVKALFQTIHLSMSVYKLFKTYQLKKWDEFSHSLGRSIGLSTRIVLALTTGTR